MVAREGEVQGEDDSVVVNHDRIFGVLLDFVAEADLAANFDQVVDRIGDVVSRKWRAVTPHHLRPQCDGQLGIVVIVVEALSLPHDRLVAEGVPVGHALIDDVQAALVVAANGKRCVNLRLFKLVAAPPADNQRLLSGYIHDAFDAGRLFGGLFGHLFAAGAVGWPQPATRRASTANSTAIFNGTRNFLRSSISCFSFGMNEMGYRYALNSLTLRNCRRSVWL